MFKATSFIRPTTIFLKVDKRFAGHSKWANIRHTKGALDVKRGAQFAKLCLELITTIKAGGPDPQFNLRLGTLLATAKQIDLPKKNIEAAFKKASGQTDSPLTDTTYQGIGPNNIAVIIETVSDNTTRTRKAVRSLLTRAGGSLTDVNWMFEKKGKVKLVPKEGDVIDMDQLMMDTIEADAEDFKVVQEDDLEIVEIICALKDLNTVSKKLDSLNKYQLRAMEVYYHPTNVWSPKEYSQEVVEEVFKFLEQLDNMDDVIRLHTNIEE